MAILLVIIGGYSINGLLVAILLMAILLMTIGGYFINGCWWLFYELLLMVIVL